MNKLFFEPHPGLMGCVIPIPAKVKAIADLLDGTVTSIDSAVALIQSACSDGKVRSIFLHTKNQILKPQPVGYGMIVLELGEVDCGTFKMSQYNWRVIRFKNP